MSTTINTERLQRVARCAEQQVENRHFSSVEWLLCRAGETLDHGRAGYADQRQQLPLPDEPIYRIYSMTKPIVSVACLQLIEAGKLRLGDEIGRYLPQFKDLQVLQADASVVPAQRGITVVDLLTHRAGLSYDFLPACQVGALYRDARLAEDGSRTLQQLVDQLGALPLAFQPGARWQYSYATDVLGHLLEVVAEQPLPELLNRLLLQPLGMSDTGFSVAAAQRSRLLPMFGARELGVPIGLPDGPQRLTPLDVEASYPSHPEAGFARGGHGLFSTARDYQKFLGVLARGTTPDGEPLLSAAMVDMMWQNRIPAEQLPLAVAFNRLPGYGWNLFGRVMLDAGQAMKLTAAGEGGWAGAAATFFWVDRRNDFSGIVMTQYLGASVPLADDMQTAAYQAL